MPADVGEDLAAVGAEPGGERDRGRVRAAPAERRRLGLLGVGRAQALEPGHDHDLAVGQLGPDAGRVDVGDAGLAVAAVGADPGLGAGQADRRDAERVEGHRHERRALVLAGREEHVELARVGLVGDRGGEAEELVGRVAHRADDDDEIRAGRPLAGDPPGDALDPVRPGDRRAAELLHDEGGLHQGGIVAAGLGAPACAELTRGLQDVREDRLASRRMPQMGGCLGREQCRRQELEHGAHQDADRLATQDW